MPDSTRRVVAVVSSKGGVAKTTTAALMASILAEDGRSVALVDLDPQGSLSLWRSLAEDDGQGLVVPVYGLRSAQTLADDLDRITADVVVIDAPPQDGRMMAAAMSAADLVVVPSSPSDADLDRALLTAEVAFNRGRSAVLLLTMAPARDADTVEAREVLDAAEWPVLNASVRHLVAIRRSFGRAPLPEALAEYRPVVVEILDLLDGEA